MSGPDDVTVVWIEKAEGRDDASRAVADWARARGLKLATSASESVTHPASRIDFSIADRVEKELDRAREAIAALDADVAERALARADALLRDHPELPQAAWLRAEVHRGWAARFTRVEPRDDIRAQLAWQDADALDGGRAPGIGEATFPPRARTPVTFTVLGAGSRAVVVRLDGVDLTGTASEGSVAYALDVVPTEHQLVVSVDGDVAFTSWVSITGAAAGAPRARIAVRVGDEGSCAAIAGVTREGNAVRAPNVSCERWIAAVPTERRGAVLVARCERSTCGPFLEWRSEASFGAATAGPEGPVARPGGGWPAWATWAAIGVGAAAATTITLIAAGVFEARPVEERFVAGGVRVQ